MLTSSHPRGVVIALMFACGSGALAADPAALAARYTSEAPEAWKQYRDANRFAQGVMSGKEFEEEWKRNESCRSIRIQDKKADTSELFAENSKYSFYLKKSPKKPDWVLVGIHMNGQRENAVSERIRSRLERYQLYADIAVRLSPGEAYYFDLIASSSTRLESIREKQEGGRTLVEVRHSHRAKPEDLEQLEEFTLLLDPENGWLPVSTSSRTRYKLALQFQTVSRSYGGGSFPQPSRTKSRQEFEIFDKTEYKPHDSEAEDHYAVPAKLPDETEFTLSAYGLPEPIGVKWEKPTPRYIWFLAAAGTFAGLAIVVRILAQRRAKKG